MEGSVLLLANCTFLIIKFTIAECMRVHCFMKSWKTPICIIRANLLFAPLLHFVPALLV